MTTLAIDIDDVICTNHRKLSYDKCEPRKEVINKINELHDKLGFEIVLHTSRGMISCNGDINKAIEKNESILKEWLENNNVKYDKIIFGKPFADLYIDDRALDVIDFLQTDFRKIDNGKSGNSVYQLGKLVKKTIGNDEDTKMFKDWIEDNKGYCMYPRICSYVYNDVYMNYIDGKNLSECLDVNKLVRLCNIINSFGRIRYDDFEVKYLYDILDLNKEVVTSHYISRFANDIDYVKRHLQQYEQKLKKSASFCHGDTTLSNIVVDKNDNFFFIDQRYKRESSSYLLDFAKLRMSLSGYENELGLSKYKYDDLINVLDNILIKQGNFEVVLMLELMFICRTYRYNINNFDNMIKLHLLFTDVKAEYEELIRKTSNKQ